jgi:hypothetical protein
VIKAIMRFIKQTKTEVVLALGKLSGAGLGKTEGGDSICWPWPFLGGRGFDWRACVLRAYAVSRVL